MGLAKQGRILALVCAIDLLQFAIILRNRLWFNQWSGFTTHEAILAFGLL
jgi:hypothetical protein